MRQTEYEQLIADYGKRLGERERTALAVFLPLLAALILTPFAISGLVPRVVFIASVFALLAVLALAGVWIAVRAWRQDRREGAIAPCPACGADLAMLYDDVMPTGLCPRCGARAITDAV